MSYHSQRLDFRNAVARIFAPPPQLGVDEWAEQYRFLSQESSALPGKFDLSRTPHCELPLQMLSPNHPAKRVLLPWSSQIAKTTIAENFLGYIMHQDPGPCLVVQPNVEPMGKAFSTDRLAPMIRDTPVLTGLVQDSDKRNSGNTIGRKTFPGGYVAIAGANSPAGLASRPIRYLINDELNRWEATKEGNSLLLARKRLARFPNSKELTVSSRTFDGVGIDGEVFGAMDEDGERGAGADQIYYWSLACLNCGEYQYPEFKHFKFTDNDPDTVEYECASCGHRHTQEDEDAIKQTGAYVLDKDDGVEVVALFANTFGALLCRWRDSVDAFLKAKGDPDKLQVVVNTDFNETWKDVQGEGLDGHYLLDQRETYPAEVPERAVVLTFGADVQADRIECEVVGWDALEESWSIDYEIFDGDTSSVDNEVWQEFKAFLKGQYQHEAGRKIGLTAGVIDAGFMPSVVHAFVKELRRRYVWAGIGRSGKRPIIETKEQRQKRLRRSRSKRRKSEIIGVDEAKMVLYSRLKLKPSDTPQPGFCHFPIDSAYDAEHFDQLTAERLVRKLLSGQTTLSWQLGYVGQRNEALDCRVYAHAALRLLEPNFARYQKRLLPLEEPPESTEQPPLLPGRQAGKTRASKRSARRRSRAGQHGGYVTQW